MTSGFDQNSYYQTTLSGIVISKSTIPDTEFEDCVFKKVNMTDCTLERCRFISCKFQDCVLSAIKPTNSFFTECRFENCKVIGVDWSLAKNVQFLSFTNCQINYSNFRFLKLPKLIVTNCTAKETDFTEADISEGNFEGTDFEGTRFLKTKLMKANFKNARNYSIDIRNNTIKGAQFSFPEAMSLLNGLEITIDF